MPVPPGAPFQLKKNIWTDADFDQMGWHDNPIHAMRWMEGSYPNDFSMDIDYLFAWVNPESEGQGYSFWISPCTITFHGVTNLHVNSNQVMGIDSIPIILSIERVPVPDGDPQPAIPGEWAWTLELVEGEISLRSTGYTQYVRKNPVHLHSQVLTQAERGGISFDHPGDIGT